MAACTTSGFNVKQLGAGTIGLSYIRRPGVSVRGVTSIGVGDKVDGLFERTVSIMTQKSDGTPDCIPILHTGSR